MHVPKIAAPCLRRVQFLLPVALTLLLLPSAALAQSQPWMNPSLAPAERATLLVGAMTLEQKQQQLVGSPPETVPELPNCRGARHVRGIAALGIPTLRITNGPVGIGQNDCVDASVTGFGAFTHPSSAKATALPSATAVAASFDPAIATVFGEVIGTEANALALHVFEAPGMNLGRNPLLGRNFEYFGEDPFLAGTMAVSEVKAVQAKGVIAMAKHFAANEQETNRMKLQTVVEPRVLRELYLLPFEMAVKDGRVAAVMCAYNFVNGFQACENTHLLTEILRGEWGFDGYVQTDFFAAKSTAPSMRAGLDHLMPSPSPFWSAAELNAALAAGTLQAADLDKALVRRYTQMFRLGIFERQPLVQKPIDFAAGGAKARAIGVESGVLLQNDNHVLPFDPKAAKNVVLIGKATQVYAQQAVAGGVMPGQPMGAGGGSSDVVPSYTVSPRDGLKDVLTALGNPAATVTLVTVKDDNSDLPAAIAAATAADVVIIMAGTVAEEGADRATFATSAGETLTATGDSLDWYAARPSAISTTSANAPGNSQTVAMITAILGARSTTPKSMAAKTALVLKDNASVAMAPALLGPAGPAILEVWFPGQEDGHIVGDLLFGVANPSGKLPFTFPKAGQGFLDWAKTDPALFPGVRNATGQPEVTYKEGLNVGYRWYDARGVAPAFPFGHGLSYTSFRLSSLVVTPRVSDGRQAIRVQFVVENTGKRFGAEVPQVYLGLPPAVGEPPSRLVGFQKVALHPGEKKTVQITIDPAATNHPLAYWDEGAKAWAIADGQYTVHVGTSSRNLVLKDAVTVRTAQGGPAAHAAGGATTAHPNYLETPPGKKPRVVITADPELDDNNSMIRYILMSDGYRTEGLIYASSQFHWSGDGTGKTLNVPGREYNRNGLNLCPCTSWRWNPKERFIHDILDAYEKAYPNLKVHSRGYPTPADLRSKVKWGNVQFDGEMEKDTDGSNLIKALLLDRVDEPIYLHAWGGLSTIARALKSIEEQYRDTPQWPAIRAKVIGKAVIHPSGDQDGTGAAYIRPNWPEIRYGSGGGASAGLSYNAQAGAADADKVYYSAAWMQEHISSKGEFGRLQRVWGDGKQMVKGDRFDYFGESGKTAEALQKDGYVVWTPPRPKGEFLGEGDTGTFLSLLDNGLEGWRQANRRNPAVPRPPARFLRPLMHDLAARMTWAVTPKLADANHYPTVTLKRSQVSGRPGDLVTLSASTTDPDGDKVSVKWWRFDGNGTYAGAVTLETTDGPTTSFRIPADARAGDTIHIIAEASDAATLSLTRYARAVVTVK